MGYYDIDDILADGSKFSCKFNYDIPGLGYLEGNPGQKIKKNTKIELPFWLANVLAIVLGDQKHENEEALPFVQLLTPDMFSSKVINAIKSDATALNVHSISAHFYSLGIKWAALFSDEELAAVLNQMILERSQEINNHAASVSLDPDLPLSDSTARFLLTLDEFEKQLYRDAHDSCRRTKEWIAKK